MLLKIILVILHEAVGETELDQEQECSGTVKGRNSDRNSCIGFNMASALHLDRISGLASEIHSDMNSGVNMDSDIDLD